MLQSRLKAHVTTPALTYRAHTMCVEEFTDTGNRVTISDGEVDVAVMTDATVTTRDGDVWRAEGLVAGDPQVWRAERACSRCAPKAVFATPAYDVPR